MLTVAKFLHRTLSDAGWATDNIGQLLEGNSGLKDEYGASTPSRTSIRTCETEEARARRPCTRTCSHGRCTLHPAAGCA